jgi:hypothetical protein
MSAEWAARPSQPIQPTSTNQKALFATVNLLILVLHFIQDNEVQINTVLSMLKQTINGSHMATMALRGLNLCILNIAIHYYGDLNFCVSFNFVFFDALMQLAK